MHEEGTEIDKLLVLHVNNMGAIKFAKNPVSPKVETRQSLGDYFAREKWEKGCFLLQQW